MTILRFRGEVYPLSSDFSPKTHQVMVGGKPRTDYLIERVGTERQIVIEGLTYFELCNIQVTRKAQRKTA